MLEAQPALATDRLDIVVEQADLAAKRRLTASSKMARTSASVVWPCRAARTRSER